MGFDVKVHGGEKVADRSAIIAFGSRSEPRRSGEATSIPKVDEAVELGNEEEKTPSGLPQWHSPWWPLVV